MSNKSCGVSIVLGKRFSKARIYTPMEAKGKLQGRGLAVRIRNRMADFTVCSVYFPPRPGKKVAFGVYRDTCKALAAWLAEVLSATPGSSTPIIFADVNDGIGVVNECGKWRYLESPCISKQAARREHIHGGAGELLRAILEERHLAAQSSWSDSRTTFFGNCSDTLIDHLYGPAS